MEPVRRAPGKARNMFRIKICGITTPHDAEQATQAGADAIGLNFYPGSRRFIELPRAKEIVAAAGRHVLKVGIFVNADAGDVRKVAEEVELDLVQLHGDESPEYVASLGDMPVMRAFCGDVSIADINRFLAECLELGSKPRMVLIDGAGRGQYGGTGMTADWQRLATEVGGLAAPLVLAGGLQPQNVAEAIKTLRPAAVDTAGGVEVEPGRKSPELMQAFVSAAKQAFDGF